MWARRGGSDVKTFTIKHKGTMVILESERTKPEALKAVLKAIFNEYRKAKPESLSDLMEAFNRLYKTILQEEEIKAAKKEGRPVQFEEEPEPDDFDFWKQLMESIPGAQN
jgi:hypothetical protein